MSYTDGPRKVYTYFKAARGEINFVLNLYTLFLVSIDRVSTWMIVQGVIILALMVVLGYFSREYIDPSQTYTSPYQRDIIQYRKKLAAGLRKAHPEIAEFSDGELLLEDWIE